MTVITWETIRVNVKGGTVTVMLADVGPYSLYVQDATGELGLVHIVQWGATGPAGRTVGEGVCDTAEEAQAAAEDCARRLIGEAAAHPDDELNRQVAAQVQRIFELHGGMAESIIYSVIQKVAPEQWAEWYGSPNAWPFPFDPYPITDEILLKAGIEPPGTATGTDVELPQF